MNIFSAFWGGGWGEGGGVEGTSLCEEMRHTGVYVLLIYCYLHDHSYWMFIFIFRAVVPGKGSIYTMTHFFI